MLNTTKKAAVLGGSSGIGLALTRELIGRGYHVDILSRSEPEISLADLKEHYTHRYCDLLDFDEGLFEGLAQDKNIDCLVITAGFGRVADFEDLHTAEIEKLIKVNTTAVLKIIRIFYERIKNSRRFYCGVMGSIAGLVSSPMFSVYAASKAAVCRFVESVNIELEAAGTPNRILNISPGSVKGTRFNGAAETKPELLRDLAETIVTKLMDAETIYIPDYEAIYKDVLDRYAADGHAFGVSSYNYKKNSGRAANERRAVVGYLSGTFDLFHVGHLNLLRRAKKQCDYLVVGVHTDASHKGKETFIPYEERKQILSAIKYVDKVVQSCREDADAWELYHYDRLFVGSDYKGTERFERYEKFFEDKGVEIIYFPYTKGTSSTQIRNLILDK